MMTYSDDVLQSGNAARFAFVTAVTTRKVKPQWCRLMISPTVNWMWNNPVREENSRAQPLRTFSPPLLSILTSHLCLYSCSPSLPPSLCVCSICWCLPVSERGWGHYSVCVCLCVYYERQTQSVGVCMSMCLPATLYSNGYKCSCGDNACIVPAHYSRLCANLCTGEGKKRGREREREVVCLACLSATPGLLLPPPTFVPFSPSIFLALSYTLLLLCSSSLSAGVSMRTESVGYGGVGGFGGVCDVSSEHRVCVCMCTYNACCSLSHVSPGKSCSRLCQKTCLWHYRGNLD